MALNLEQIATATGGVLVTAAGKKQVKPNLQHHKTFGIKKPKGSLPGASAGGWMKKSSKKVIIPNTKNAAALEKLADKLARYSFVTRTASNKWSYTLKNTSATISVDGDRVYFDVHSPYLKLISPAAIAIDKVTSKQLDVFLRYMQEVAMVKLPKVPAFLVK